MPDNVKLTRTEEVAIKLRKMILEKEILSGQQIVQDAISKKMEVSKIPVREALKILESEGLVYSEPYKGSFVSNISTEYIKETFFLRSILEGVSCTQATNNFDEGSLNDLNHIIEQAKEAYEKYDTVLFIKYSKKFHSYIHSLSGYKRLNSILHNLDSSILSIHVNNLKEQGRKSLTEHRFIYEKIKEKDAVGAGNAMRMHQQRVGMDAVQELKVNKNNPS